MARTSAREIAGQNPAPRSDPVATIGAAEFKARCLQIMDRVRQTGAEVTITKHGHPVAKLVPADEGRARPALIGACKDSLVIVDDDDEVPSTADEWIGWEAGIERGWDDPGET